MDTSDFWVIDELGKHITRAEAADRRIDGAIGGYDPFAELVEKIRTDPRKSFSKGRILDLIEEMAD